MQLTASQAYRLSNQHLLIAELLKTTNPERLNSRPSPGQWSIHDQVAHLARYHVVFYDRLQQIVKGPQPQFERYAAELDPDFPEWQHRSIGELLNNIEVERQKVSNFFQALQEKDLTACAIHPRFGKLSLSEWLDFFLLHEAHHIFTIFQLSHDVNLK
jgi:uncharacterized damage-inducible protein DinB